MSIPDTPLISVMMSVYNAERYVADYRAARKKRAAVSDMRLLAELPVAVAPAADCYALKNPAALAN